jgi:aquaporin Z
MKKYFAELAGTFILVFFGCGTIVFAGGKVGIIGIAAAFGLAQAAVIYGLGPVSGAHVNPAVSFGVWSAGRMSAKDMVGYWVAQFVGAILASLVLWGIASGVAGGYNIGMQGLGQTGWGPGYQGGYNIVAAIIFEFVATMLFLIVILGATQKSAPKGFAGIAIGIALGLINVCGIHVSGASVNAARSFGPALLVGGKALAQVWMFLVVPSLGGIAGGLFFRSRALQAADPTE